MLCLLLNVCWANANYSGHLPENAKGFSGTNHQQAFALPKPPVVILDPSVLFFADSCVLSCKAA